MGDYSGDRLIEDGALDAVGRFGADVRMFI